MLTPCLFRVPDPFLIHILRFPPLCPAPVLKTLTLGNFSPAVCPSRSPAALLLGDYQCVAMRRSHFCSRTFIHNGHLEFHANVLDFCNCMKRMRAFATCVCMHFRLFVACVCKFSRFFSCTSTFAHTPTLHALSGQATSFA